MLFHPLANAGVPHGDRAAHRGEPIPHHPGLEPSPTTYDGRPMNGSAAMSRSSSSAHSGPRNHRNRSCSIGACGPCSRGSSGSAAQPAGPARGRTPAAPCRRNSGVSSRARTCSKYPSPIPHTPSGVAAGRASAGAVHGGSHRRPAGRSPGTGRRCPVRRAADDRRPAGGAMGDRHVRCCAGSSASARIPPGDDVRSDARLRRRGTASDRPTGSRSRDLVEQPRRVPPSPAAHVQLRQSRKACGGTARRCESASTASARTRSSAASGRKPLIEDRRRDCGEGRGHTGDPCLPAGPLGGYRTRFAPRSAICGGPGRWRAVQSPLQSDRCWFTRRYLATADGRACCSRAAHLAQ